MKTCPYCAEEIQDAAIKCRYCQSWLVSEIPAEAETPPPGVVVHEPREPAPSAAAGAGEEKAEEKAAPVQERTTETVAVTEPAGEERPSAEAAGTATTATAGAEAEAVSPPEFTHSGERFLLGYTDVFFGIWDRQSPDAPSERFPRTDDGWREAWQRYVAIESNWMDLRSGQRSR